MSRDQKRFLIIVTILILAVAGSGFFVSHQIYRLTQNKIFFKTWVLLCFLFQTPLIIIPLDRGRLLGFIGKVLPQWFILILITWNLTQIFLLLLGPVIIFLPSSPSLFNYFPVILTLILFAVVFRSAFRVVERKITIKPQSLPGDWKPLTILHLSDIHSGPFMRYPHLDKIISRINQKSFDLCVVTGDVVNHSSKDLGWTLTLLEKIKAPLGVFASIGNHEYIDSEKEIIQGYKNSKIELLLDSSRIISTGKHNIRLIGVDFPFESDGTSEEEIKVALAKSLSSTAIDKNEFQILLSHHPNGFKSAQALGIPLTLSGHTHGGQIKFGKINVVSALYKYIMGLYESGGSFLYVSAGLGNWLPFRINVPCEYALITIES